MNSSNQQKNNVSKDKPSKNESPETKKGHDADKAAISEKKEKR